MRNKEKRKNPQDSRSILADVIIYFIIGLVALFALYPFIYTLASSLNDSQDLAYGPIWIVPRKFTFASYVVIFNDKRLYVSLLNTFISTVVVVIIGLLLQSIVAYALARPELKHKKFYWYFNLITMFIHGGMIPTYMVILLLGLYDNFLVYILPSIYSVYNIIVMTNFFRSIDKGIYEAAVLDGASEYRIWWQIFLPLSKPVLATIGLWIMVGKWNSYMPTMLYTSKNESIWTLQYYLMQLIRDGDIPAVDSQYSMEVSAKTLSFAAIIISSIPILLVYPLLNKYFDKGATVGSIKG